MTEESALLILSKKVIELQDHIDQLLDAILWDAHSSGDEVLEIGREVAESISLFYFIKE
tara:strand:+ start:9888 stop:10064 length:177 start_codon:yes stop_codon:yes gene_type:complete